MAEINLPIDTETERLFLGALLVALPAARREMVAEAREDLFADPWHQDFYRAVRVNRDLDGDALMVPVLRSMRATWENPAAYVGRLLIDSGDRSTCGRVNNWRRYVRRLEQVAEARRGISFCVTKLNEAIDVSRNFLPELGPANSRVCGGTERRRATDPRDRAAVR